MPKRRPSKEEIEAVRAEADTGVTRQEAEQVEREVIADAE